MGIYDDVSSNYGRASKNNNWRKLIEVLNELKLIRAHSEKISSNFDELQKKKAACT